MRARTPSSLTASPAGPDASRRTAPGGRFSFQGRVELLAVAATLVVAAALRVVEIGRVGFNSDEAVYAGQGAALTGDDVMGGFFSIFRAHPLFLQLLLGGLFRTVGVSDVAARLLVSLAFGVGSVLVAYLLARRLYGGRVALATALLVAVVPYHVLISRQVLVDVPFGFFVLLTLWLLARSDDDETGRGLIPVYVAAGFAIISKEIGVLLLPVIGSYLLLTGGWRKLRFTRATIVVLHFVVILAPFVASRMLFQTTKSSGYLSWQLSRPPNHEPDYFLQIILEYGSVFVAALAVVGVVVMVFRHSRADLLVGLWLVFLLGFFQVWPTKLFSYLFAVFPALCICAAIGLEALIRWMRRSRGVPLLRARAFALPVVAFGFLCTFLASESLADVRHGPDGVAPFRFSPLRFDIEVQDFAGGREFGLWAKGNSPAGSRFLTIGPSMGNILRFYGHRESLALSVSPDPLKRNPAYVPVRNPDLLIRRGAIQYAVWDFYSADRSAFYNGRLMRYVRRYHGVPVFSASMTSEGELVVGRGPVGPDPLIVVYDLAGGDPPKRRSPVPYPRHTTKGTV